MYIQQYDMTIYYADDTIVTYDNAIAKVLQFVDVKTLQHSTINRGVLVNVISLPPYIASTAVWLQNQNNETIGKEGDKTIKEEMWVMNYVICQKHMYGKWCCLFTLCRLHIHSHIDTSTADYYIGQWNQILRRGSREGDNNERQH